MKKWNLFLLSTTVILCLLSGSWHSVLAFETMASGPKANHQKQVLIFNPASPKPDNV
jgi:hypothetical protein